MKTSDVIYHGWIVSECENCSARKYMRNIDRTTECTCGNKDMSIKSISEFLSQDFATICNMELQQEGYEGLNEHPHDFLAGIRDIITDEKQLSRIMKIYTERLYDLLT